MLYLIGFHRMNVALCTFNFNLSLELLYLSKLHLFNPANK